MNKTIATNTFIGLMLTAATNAHSAAITPVGTLNLASPGVVSMSDAGNANSYANNAALNGSSWAHTGDWFTFSTGSLMNVTVDVSAASGSDFRPGVSVWASGNTEFDGGTEAFAGETSSAGFGTPHSFNSVGAMGDFGTLWMANGSGGNMLETLAYANSGASVLSGGWGESILSGVNDVSTDNLFESGISGSTGLGYASLVFADLQPGWYTIYIGGTDSSSAGGAYDLSISGVSAVPVPAAVWLFGSGLLALAGIARKKRV